MTGHITYWRPLATILALLAVFPVRASVPVHEYRLDNGLKLIVQVDRRAPVVVSQVWYKVGAGYEHSGITGVSHVLEHMMFKGTKRHAAGEFSRIISENGGRENAFTSRDYTAYFQRLEKSRLPISFELEADRMRGLLLPEDEFRKEVRVVMEERRLRTEDKPAALTHEQLYAAAFTASPYGHPVIGWMNDLESLTVADLRAWYRRWYAPNNATVVVVGDVEPEAVLALAKRYFGPLAASEVLPPKPRLEPAQKGERRVTVRAPAELPYLMLGYKTPVLKTAEPEWEAYALEVLAGVLDGGESARLARRLVRGRQLAASASAGYSLYGQRNGLFLLSGVPARGQTAARLEKALRKEVDRFRNERVSDGELARVKAQVVASAVYERDSQFYQAMQIGTLETVGLGWPVLEEYVDKIRAVTAEQVQAVARKYFNDAGLTVAILDPLPLNDGQAMKGGQDHAR